MGDFSRDTKNRLVDSIAKHYVGVRLQQGVPILDADWNLLDDLRRYEAQDSGKWLIGNGVPVGNDGFRIEPIAGGGVNTIVLVSKSTGVGLSSVKIDLANSTAAAKLGFDSKNFMTERFGASPARLTGNKAEPFTLTDGSTLSVQADGQLAETVTFVAGDFVNIATATASEVVAAITAAMSRITAGEGTGNDFIIKGGDGTTANAGRILVEGQMAINERDIKYTQQSLYKNTALANLWGVDQVSELTTTDEPYVVYLDIWNRELGSDEDHELIDARIGVETAIRIRREWAVRVVKTADYLGIVAAKPANHSYCMLAQLNRVGADSSIKDEMIIDKRSTDHSLRREIAYRGADGSVRVDSLAFLNMLVAAQDNIRDFVKFLTTRFVTPGSPYVAGEVAGIDTLASVSRLADQGISLLNAKSLDTNGAFSFFGQLLDAENRFVDIWKNAVLPLNKGTGKIYEAAYKQLIERIEKYLTGPARLGFTAITEALSRRNLLEAVRSQEQINAEFGNEIDRPTGSLVLTYLGSPTVTIPLNQSFDVLYRVSGSVTPQDDIDVEVFIDSAWHTTLKKSDGSLPFSLRLGPGSDSKEFVISIQTPNVAGAKTDISLRVSAHHNSGGLYYISAQKHLKIGNSPPPSEQDFAFRIATINVNQVGGVFQVPTTLSSADINFHLVNNTNAPVTVDLEFQTTPSPPLPWTVVKGPFSLTGHTIAAHGESTDLLFHFVPPATTGETLSFILRAKNASTNAVIAETQIALTTVS